MRLCVFAVALVAAAGSAAAATPDYDGVGRAAPPGDCPTSKPTRTAGPAAEPGPQRLDRLPQAVRQLTVLKSVGGCPVAAVKVGDRTYDVPLPAVRGPTPLDATPRRR